MSCCSRLFAPAVSTGCYSLAEAVRVNRASEPMANSTRPASADAAGITPRTARGGVQHFHAVHFLDSR